MALLNRPIHPPLPSLLPLPVHFPPFPVPLSLSPPSFPFLTLPFPLSRYPCDLPQPFWPFALLSRGRGSTRSVRLRGWDDWEGERERDREHERAGPPVKEMRCSRPPVASGRWHSASSGHLCPQKPKQYHIGKAVASHDCHVGSDCKRCCRGSGHACRGHGVQAHTVRNSGVVRASYRVRNRNLV
jgi:hypothetical protein